MKKLLTLIGAAAFAAAAMNTQAATTNLLQSVSVSFTVFTQGAPIVTSKGTNNVVSHNAFGSHDLVRAVSGTYHSGDMLVRATPVTNAPVTVTNLVPVWTNTLLLTNTSTSTQVISNELIFGTNNPIAISTNVTFGTNIEVIGSIAVTLGSNIATAGATTIDVGTNTSVTASVVTNNVGFILGTNYVFVSNTLTNSASSTNILGTASWQIFNPADHGTLTPISTNVTFAIYTDKVYDDTNAVALIHGEFIKRDHVIKSGTTEEIRTLILSNSTWNIKMVGYAHGHYVPVSLGGSDVVYSQDLNWSGSGSGLMGTNTPAVIEGNVLEDYFKFLK
jgi:hypothetical protein